MTLISLETHLENLVTGMNDDVIVKIVRKLGFAVWRSVHKHAQTLALTSAAAIPVALVWRHFRARIAEWHMEWQWERKCDLTLVSGQLWAPVSAEEMGRMRHLETRTISPGASAGASTQQSREARQDMEGVSDVCPLTSSLSMRPSALHCQRECTDVPSLGDKTKVCCPVGVPQQSGLDDDHDKRGEGSEHGAGRAHGAQMLSGVVKRTLFQEDIWFIGILRDKRMHRKVIEAANKTTEDDPFVTSFLDDADTWYVMNAIVNQLSSLCVVSHLGALHSCELHSYDDAFIVALMVPRVGGSIKREFLGEEFSEAATALTKIRAVVVKERHVVQVARRHLCMDPKAPPRFAQRWKLLELIGDKYRRFEACKILRAAIEREERDLVDCGQWSSSGEESTTDSTHSASGAMKCDLERAATERAMTPSTIFSRADSKSTMFSRTASPMEPEKAYEMERARSQRVREISEQQFVEAAAEMGLSTQEADVLFTALDVNGDGMLSVDEVESESHKKAGLYEGRNYISMDLQRVFLPVPSSRGLS